MHYYRKDSHFTTTPSTLWTVPHKSAIHPSPGHPIKLCAYRIGQFLQWQSHAHYYFPCSPSNVEKKPVPKWVSILWITTRTGLVMFCYVGSSFSYVLCVQEYLYTTNQLNSLRTTSQTILSWISMFNPLPPWLLPILLFLSIFLSLACV